MTKQAGTAVVLMALVLGAGACGDDPAAVEENTQLALVSPAGGAVAVDRAGTITVEFNGSMMAGMEQYMVLHEGDVTGPLVAGSWSWAGDRRRVTFSPAAPLKAAARYTLHLGGGMMDADGHTVGLGRNGSGMGGQWATSGMMGAGMGSTSSMMGEGWRHANGSFGMLFTFTTA